MSRHESSADEDQCFTSALPITMTYDGDGGRAETDFTEDLLNFLLVVKRGNKNKKGENSFNFRS